MVKGISRQVILVQSADKDIFEQAIFILKDNAQTVTEEMLLKEAKRSINSPVKKKFFTGPLWACAGATITGIAWLISIFL